MSGLKRNTGWALTLIIAVLCSIVLALPVLAGQGDGSGGGKNQPLALVSSSPAAGQKDVALSAEIKLTFSKNVVYMTIRDSNRKCFTLSQDGKDVPIEVIMADDQIEFDKRNDVVIKPLQELQAGTTYTVKVAPQLESKSGVNLGEELKLSFTTAGVETAAPKAETAGSTTNNSDSGTANTAQDSNNAPANPSEEPVTSDELTSNRGQDEPGEQANSITETTEADTSRESDHAKTPDAEKEKNDQGINPGIIITVIILAAALAYVIYRKRGK